MLHEGLPFSMYLAIYTEPRRCVASARLAKPQQGPYLGSWGPHFCVTRVSNATRGACQSLATLLTPRQKRIECEGWHSRCSSY